MARQIMRSAVRELIFPGLLLIFINLLMVQGIGRFPEDEIHQLNEWGVIEGIERVPVKNHLLGRKYHDNMNTRDTLVTDLNVLADFNPVLPKAYKDSELYHAGQPDSGYPNVSHPTNEYKTKTLALDTMNFWMDVAKTVY